MKWRAGAGREQLPHPFRPSLNTHHPRPPPSRHAVKSRPTQQCPLPTSTPMHTPLRARRARSAPRSASGPSSGALLSAFRDRTTWDQLQGSDPYRRHMYSTYRNFMHVRRQQVTAELYRLDLRDRCMQRLGEGESGGCENTIIGGAGRGAQREGWREPEYARRPPYIQI